MICTLNLRYQACRREKLVSNGKLRVKLLNNNNKTNVRGPCVSCVSTKTPTLCNEDFTHGPVFVDVTSVSHNVRH